eukprot:CAMPEP_0172593146 /NCGR_PEP_ID=MMETSP1068-20121228/12313_1 /TAXON_ID=35684 /ORGANISM="Pseudopedinella elastica, Strain CCMP716" /LENGTH=510 /DNA_ID=CAMNT_0013390537 /DNA_START=18 /DNA_END=1550 /DNA_ORIENTATION=+
MGKKKGNKVPAAATHSLSDSTPSDSTQATESSPDDFKAEEEPKDPASTESAATKKRNRRGKNSQKKKKQGPKVGSSYTPSELVGEDESRAPSQIEDAEGSTSISSSISEEWDVVESSKCLLNIPAEKSDGKAPAVEPVPKLPLLSPAIPGPEDEESMLAADKESPGGREVTGVASGNAIPPGRPPSTTTGKKEKSAREPGAEPAESKGAEATFITDDTGGAANDDGRDAIHGEVVKRSVDLTPSPNKSSSSRTLGSPLGSPYDAEEEAEDTDDSEWVPTSSSSSKDEHYGVYSFTPGDEDSTSGNRLLTANQMSYLMQSGRAGFADGDPDAKEANQREDVEQESSGSSDGEKACNSSKTSGRSRAYDLHLEDESSSDESLGEYESREQEGGSASRVYSSTGGEATSLGGYGEEHITGTDLAKDDPHGLSTTFVMHEARRERYGVALVAVGKLKTTGMLAPHELAGLKELTLSDDPRVIGPVMAYLKDAKFEELLLALRAVAANSLAHHRL